MHVSEDVSLLAGKINELFKAMRKVDKTKEFVMGDLLSVLLHHPSPEIRIAVGEAILPTDCSSKHSPANCDCKFPEQTMKCLREYQLRYLNKILQVHGIQLLSDREDRYTVPETDGTGIVWTYRGQRYDKQGQIQYVLCRASIPDSLHTIATHRQLNSDNLIIRHIDILHRLANHKGFVKCLAHDKDSQHTFYITDHDWNLDDLSDILLRDLKSRKQKIELKHKIQIIRSMIESTMYAHRYDVLLRSFTTESFIVKKIRIQDGYKFKIQFWSIDAMATNNSDSDQSHYRGGENVH